MLFLSSLIRTVVSLHDLVKIKEDSLKHKEVKQEKKQEESSEEDDVPFICRVCNKPMRSARTGQRTTRPSRVPCSGGRSSRT